MSSSDMNLIVQISGKRNSYIERVSLGASGLTLGRAWGSDIIIQDRYVDSAQLRISLSEQGSVIIEDLASTNGSMLAGLPLNGKAQNYHWGDEIRAGDTTIKVYDVAAEVEQTSLRSSWHSLQRYFESWQSLAIVSFLSIFFSTVNEWAFKVVPMSTSELGVSFVSSAASVLVWTLVFGSISKLVQGRSNMRVHLGLVSLAGIAAVLIEVVNSTTRFNLQSPELAYWSGQVLYGCLFLFFCYALLTYTTLLGSRVKWLGAALLVGGGIAVANVDSVTKEPHQLWNDRSNAEQTTLPPAFLFRDSVALDDYFSHADDLFDQAQESD